MAMRKRVFLMLLLSTALALTACAVSDTDDIADAADLIMTASDNPPPPDEGTSVSDAIPGDEPNSVVPPDETSAIEHTNSPPTGTPSIVPDSANSPSTPAVNPSNPANNPSVPAGRPGIAINNPPPPAGNSSPPATSSSNAPTVSIGRVTARQGEASIVVPVNISNAPGLRDVVIEFSYDPSLTLTGFRDGENTMRLDPISNHDWNMLLLNDSSASGYTGSRLIELLFSVSDSAATGRKNIGISYIEATSPVGSVNLNIETGYININ
jgi:hypothetical protein